MLQDFDAAILDRIQLKLQYHDLDSSARQAIFRHFSAKTGADVVEDEIRNFAEVSLNGRQVRDSVRPEMYAYTDIISKDQKRHQACTQCGRV
jgi:hypothetical protein